MLILILLSILLFVSIISDFYSRRIPNSLIMVGLLLGFALSGFSLNGDISLIQSIMGATVGLLLLLPIYLLGKMGAGDVKLLAMCGSFLGVETTLMAGLCTLMAGGFFALIWLWLANRFSIQDKRYPYSPAIVAGAFMAPYLHFN